MHIIKHGALKQIKTRYFNHIFRVFNQHFYVTIRIVKASDYRKTANILFKTIYSYGTR